MGERAHIVAEPVTMLAAAPVGELRSCDRGAGIHAIVIDHNDR
jgi:hypothetical protein